TQHLLADADDILDQETGDDRQLVPHALGLAQVDLRRFAATHDINRHGPLTRRGTAATSSTVCGASTKAMSAPAAIAALARAIASSKPATARASVRAMTRKSGLRREAAAARILASQSSRGTISLSSRWPHFFGKP